MKHVLYLLLFFISTCSLQQKEQTPLVEFINQGTLTVGTTGDYPPFSSWSENKFQGIDIEMAQNLAQSLGVQLKIIKTSWPNLLEDLKNKKFDIAMSGISKTIDRQKVALFSQGYVQYGKMGISLCKNAKKYKTLKSIDRPQVTMIVNRGGTNHGFVKQNIKRAKVIYLPTNKKVFDYILKSKADVMITDSVEVLYQSKKHKNVLCPTMKKTLTQSEIAILMPKDIVLKERIDLWLNNFEKTGQKKVLFDSYFN